MEVDKVAGGRNSRGRLGLCVDFGEGEAGLPLMEHGGGEEGVGGSE